MADVQKQDAYNPWADTDQMKASQKVDAERRNQLSAMKAQAQTAMNQALMAFESDPQNQIKRGSPQYDQLRQQVQDQYGSQIQQFDSQLHDLDQKANGLNPDGSPVAPDWHSLIDPATGQLRDQYKLNIGALDPNSFAGWDQLKGDATRAPGTDNAWATIARQQLAQNQAQAMDAASVQGASSTNQAMSNLAMRGGLQNGARTFLANQQQKNLLGARQGVNQQGIMGNLDISKTAESQRQDQLSKLLGYETDVGKYNKTLEANTGQYNQTGLMNEIQGHRSWEQDQWKQQMDKWAAGKQADATMHSGGGGK